MNGKVLFCPPCDGCRKLAAESILILPLEVMYKTYLPQFRQHDSFRQRVH